MSSMRRLGWTLIMLAACGDDTNPSPDMMTDECPSACDDGMFCNGVEVCDPTSAAADDRGCVSGAPPCVGSTCDEDLDECVPGCVDADGDGAQAASCGGDDCDDLNPNRFPGNVEVCDSAGLDEDCDPSTLGDDADGDGYVSDECCNQQGDGLLRCGTDCNDDSSDINPEVVDVCGNGDQDCDGDIDEDPDQVFYRDFDNDGFGNIDMVDTLMACSAIAGYAPLATDCDDTRGDVSPSSPEQCDSGLVDENCNGTANEGCGCSPTGTERTCGSEVAQSGVGTCQGGIQTCEVVPGGTEWSSCAGDIDPVAETCNGLDDDCNGTPDDAAAFECVQGSDPISGTNDCGRMGTRECGANCLYTTADFALPESSGTCDYCADSGAGLSAEVSFADQETFIEWVGIGGLGAPTYERLGDANDFDGVMFLESFGTGAASQNEAGAWYLADLQRVGYGSVTFDVEIRANGAPSGVPENTGEGWAVVVVEEGCSARLGSSGAFLAVPRGCNGFAVENRFVEIGNITNPADSIVIRRLNASSSDPVIGPVAFWTSSRRIDNGDTTNQRLRYTLTTDLPDTPTNETSLNVEFVNFGTTFVQGPRCGFSGTPDCGFRIQAGRRYHFGITGSTGSYVSDMWWGGGDTRTPELRIRGLCR